MNRECEAEAPLCDLGTNRCKACTPDAYEPNDSIESAIPAMSAQGQLNTCGGPDFFAVSAGTGQTVVAEVMFTHATGDVDIRLFDQGMSQVASSAGTGDSETIEYLVSEEGGTFFLEVYGYNGGYNDYTMSVVVR